MIDAKKLVELSSYFSIVHHIKGRIRLRVSSKIKELKNDSNITIDDIQELPNKVNGIKSLKINKLVGSITIEYDNSIFAYELWEDLINQRDLERIATMLNELYKDYKGDI